MAKTKVNYAIVADVETGGLPSKTKKAFYDVALTEVAFVVIDLSKLEIVEKLSWLLEPDYKEGLEYHPKALESTGISKELLREQGLPVSEVHHNTRSVLKKYTKGRYKPIIVGHNVYKFDAPFFRNMYESIGDDFEEYIAGYEDTMILGGLKYLESKNYKLGTICNNLGVELTEAHRALPDTIANAEMFIEMIRFLRSGSKKSGGNKFREKFKLDVSYEF